MGISCLLIYQFLNVDKIWIVYWFYIICWKFVWDLNYFYYLFIMITFDNMEMDEYYMMLIMWNGIKLFVWNMYITYMGVKNMYLYFMFN